MKKNIGTIDMIIRIALAVILVIFIVTGIPDKTWSIVFGIIAAIALVTGFMNVCPLYTVLGISTICKKDTEIDEQA